MNDQLVADRESVLELESASRTIEAFGHDRLLTAEEEIDLAKRIERGDLDAKDELISHNLRLVVAIATRYRPIPGRSTEDTIQDGMFGLVRAAEKFDWRRGYKFSTYAVRWIKQSIQREADNNERMIRRPVTKEQITRNLVMAEKKLVTELGREPTTEELATKLELDPQEVVESEATRYRLKSLDEQLKEDSETTFGSLIPDTETDVSAEVVKSDTFARVVRSLDNLPQNLREVIETLYFDSTDGNHQKAAQKLGITQEKLIEHEREALIQLHETIVGGDPDEFQEYYRVHHQPPVTREDRMAAVWGYKAMDPELTFVEIGKRLGILPERARDYYNRGPNCLD